MSADPLPPIPMPPGQRWKLFRERGLPAIAFLGVLVLAVWLWGENLANPLVMGQAESAQADVVSPVDGQLVQLNVAQYQAVNAGDVIGIVSTMDRELLDSRLALTRAEFETSRESYGLAPDDQMRLANLKLDWIDLRGQLAATRISLAYAVTNLNRATDLYSNDISSQELFELAQLNVEHLRIGQEAKEKAIAAAEATLQEFDASLSTNAGASALAQVKLAEQRFRLMELEMSPKVLKAPIGGLVIRLEVSNDSQVSRRQVLATIAAPKAERIVGYIPQPVRVEPKVGMPVEVRRRGNQRTVALSSVKDIGPRIEVFDAPLRVRGMGAAQERGLPVVVNVPANMNLRPGELVDLRLIDN